MDLLGKLEQALESIFEGVFSRAFKTPLQPIEVARKLTRALENHRTVSVNATYVPNAYRVLLSHETYAEYIPIGRRLQSELAQYLIDYISEHQYQTVGPVAVTIAEDDRFRGQDFEVAAANQEAPSSAVSPIERAVPEAQPGVPATALNVVGGELLGHCIPLANDLTIGRGPTNTVALNEPGVSRRHVEIRQLESGWEIRDLQSTNGTYLNSRRIVSALLAPGDVVQIGQTLFLVV